MTDTSILPSAADAGAAPSTPAFADEPDDDRRRLMIIGGAIAAVLVLLVGYLLLHGGGSTTPTSGAVPRGTPHAVTSPASGADGGSTASGSQGASSGGAKAGTKLPAKSKRPLAKDPFKPLVVDQSLSGGTTGSTTDVNGTGTTPGTVPTSPSEGGAPGAATGPPLAVKLVDVLGESVAVFDVTYAHHQVFRFQVQAPPPGSSRGTVFAQDFALLGIQNKQATIQIGDDTPFDMKRGSSRAV